MPQEAQVAPMTRMNASRITTMAAKPNYPKGLEQMNLESWSLGHLWLLEYLPFSLFETLKLGPARVSTFRLPCSMFARLHQGEPANPCCPCLRVDA